MAYTLRERASLSFKLSTENQPDSEKKVIIEYTRKYSFENKDANRNKENEVCTLLEDKASDCLQIWMAASLLNLISQIQSQIICSDTFECQHKKTFL